MNIKKNLQRALAASMSVFIMCAGVGTAAFSAGAESAGAVTTAQKSDAPKAESKEKTAQKAQYNKKETVYVIADAQGTPEKVIVSNWIQNTGKEKKLTDKTNLKDIEVLKGDNSFTIDENNVCEWDANGGDIYYKGTGSTDLPVGVNISYELDGKAVSPAELAGKSGKLKIKINYINRQYSEETVNGRKEKIYVPFVMMTGMMLDNEKADNVTVTNGKVVNDGTHTFVVGFALPGMQDTLQLKSDELTIPSSVEITADVKDFELATTLTLAANDIFSDLDVDKLDSKAKELNGKLDELVSATDKLLDGTSQLYSGLSTLLDKSGELIDGVNQLYNGSEQIKNGAESLKNGASAVKDGAVQLDSGIGKVNSGAESLKSGAATLSDGAAQVDSGAGSLATGAAQLDSGIAQLQGYIAQLSGGLNTISANSSQLTGGAKQVFNTLLSEANKQISAAGLTAPELTIENYGEVLDKLLASLSDDNASALAEQTARDTVTATVESQRELIRQGVENAVRKQVTEAVLATAGLSMTADEYDAAVAAGQIPDEVQAQVSTGVSTQMSAMQGVIDEKTEAQIQSIIEENMNSEQVQAQISEGVQRMASGRASLQALKNQLDSYNTFYQGIISYTSGVDQANSGAAQILSGSYAVKNGSGELASGSAQLKDGTGQLSTGANQLKDGSAKLAEGTGELSAGAISLSDGTAELFDGIATLKGKIPSLIDGITQLKDGSMQLDEGMKEFKAEGVDKLKSAADGDIKSLIERIKAISKVSKSYKSYSGISDGAQGQVDFIYKTEGIEDKK